VLLREEIWLATFRQAARNDTSLIFTFAPEATVRSHFIQDAINVVESAGGKIVFVELTCEESELERRIETPSRKEFDKLQSIEQYRELKEAGAFEFPPIESALSVDTTNLAPEDSAKTIYDQLGG
jgi:hypothetical protein